MIEYVYKGMRVKDIRNDQSATVLRVDFLEKPPRMLLNPENSDCGTWWASFKDATDITPGRKVNL